MNKLRENDGPLKIQTSDDIITIYDYQLGSTFILLIFILLIFLSYYLAIVLMRFLGYPITAPSFLIANLSFLEHALLLVAISATIGLTLEVISRESSILNGFQFNQTTFEIETKDITGNVSEVIFQHQIYPKLRSEDTYKQLIMKDPNDTSEKQPKRLFSSKKKAEHFLSLIGSYCTTNVQQVVLENEISPAWIPSKKYKLRSSKTGHWTEISLVDPEQQLRNRIVNLLFAVVVISIAMLIIPLVFGSLDSLLNPSEASTDDLESLEIYYTMVMATIILTFSIVLFDPATQKPQIFKLNATSRVFSAYGEQVTIPSGSILQRKSFVKQHKEIEDLRIQTGTDIIYLLFLGTANLVDEFQKIMSGELNMEVEVL